MEETIHECAKHRMEELKGFYAHLGVYVMFNPGLFLINEIGSAKVRRFPQRGAADQSAAMRRTEAWTSSQVGVPRPSPSAHSTFR